MNPKRERSPQAIAAQILGERKMLVRELRGTDKSEHPERFQDLTDKISALTKKLSELPEKPTSRTIQAALMSN